ncbi:MAG TPA: hypothetical protein VHC49_18590 [Mycobacteriales bacterium]|nr:hypothetical protein [Mycobacteriales bacterium]
MSVVTMSADDAGWAAEVMHARRRVYATYSPVFWRPAADPVPGHAAFLARQIAGDDVVALRTDHGFVVGQIRGSGGGIDDFAVTDPELWATHGRSLLDAALAQMHERGAAEVQVVTAQQDIPKSVMLTDAGLTLVNQWWVKPLAPGADSVEPGRRDGAGFSGILGAAPPVYDPGGPVFLVQRLEGSVPVEAVEAAAAEWGAVLAVIPAAPDGDRPEQLSAAGFAVASDWYLSRSPAVD